MTPIFDRNPQLVAWFDGEHLFDLDLHWIAFVHDGHVFSADTRDWLGPFHDGSFLDRRGKPVGWLSDCTPTGTLKPLKPLRPLRPLKPLKPLKPLRPLKPLKPLTPLGGWSGFDWQAWLNA
jgi:Amelogenin